MIKLSLKLRTILAITVVIVLVGTVAAFFSYKSIQEILIDNEKEALNQLTLHTSHQLELQFKNGVEIANTLAENPMIATYMSSAVREFSDVQVTQVLNSYNVGGDYSSIYLMDLEGMTYASTQSSFVGNNYGFRSYFQKALDEELGVSLVLGVTSKKLGYYFSSPVKDSNGAIVGVVVMKMEPEVIHQGMNSSNGSKGYKVMMVDEFGIVIYSNDENRLLKSLAPLTNAEKDKLRDERRFEGVEILPLQYSLVRENLKNADGVSAISFYDEEDAEDEVLTYSNISIFPFFLVIEEEIDNILEDVNKFTTYLLTLIIIGIIIFIVIVAILISKLLEPLKKISLASTKVASGDYNIKLPEDGPVEVAELSRSFNKMISNVKRSKDEVEEKVKQRTSELEKVNEVLVGREEKMIDLKKQIKQMKNKK